jgi:hypothetical protein
MIWIDRSIAPTLDLACAKMALLGIHGGLVDPIARTNVLLNATAGDMVYSGPLELPFWRKLHPRVRLVSIDHPEDQDPVSNRIESWLEWALCQQDITQTEARRLLAAPPKMPQHGRWTHYQTAEMVASTMDKAAEQLGEIPRSDAGTVQEKELPYRWTLVDTEEKVELARVFLKDATRFETVIGVDCETDVAGKRPNEMRDKLVGVGISIRKECYYGSIDFEPWADLLREWLPNVSYVAHNAKYDLCVLRNAGITPGRLAGDGRLAAYLLGEPEAALKGLVLRNFDFQMITYDEVVGTGASRVNISEVDKDLVAEYCSADAYFGVEIERHLRGQLSGKALDLYTQIELPLVDILADMQFEGMPVDRDEIKVAHDEIEQRMYKLAAVVDDLALASGYVRPDDTWVCSECHNGKKKKLTCEKCKGVGRFSTPMMINLGSSKQLVEWLHDHLGLPVQALTKETQKPSVSALALLRMRELNPAIPIILEWKAADKYRGFLIKWYEFSEGDNRLHPVYNNARTRSGRLSAQEPNVQQIKLEWRKFFVASG